MITATGYSKDPTIRPEGIAITFAKAMIEEQGGLRNFLRYFNQVMADPDSYWNHYCKNRPKIEVDHVYIIIANRLYGRAYFGGYKNDLFEAWTADGRKTAQARGRIVIAGPLERCPFRRKLKGFQGFRYTTGLFHI